MKTGLLLLLLIAFCVDFGTVDACTSSANDASAMKGGDAAAGGGSAAAAPLAVTTAFTNAAIKCGTSNVGVSVAPIVGGVNAVNTQFPWQAWLDLPGWNCGGVLIHENWVITAAHCCPDTVTAATNVSIKVNLGSVKRSDNSWEYSQYSKGFAKYPYWNSGLLNGDYCLVELATKVKFTTRTLPICLASTTTLECKVNENAIISGWGLTKTGGSLASTLQYASIPIVSNSVCQSKYSSILPINVANSLEICAGGERGKSTCQGDSGGPLVCARSGTYYLSGLTSYGSASGCALKGIPAVFARIQPVYAWIKSKVGNV